MDFEDVPLIGVSSSLAIEGLILDDLKKGRAVYVSGMSSRVKKRLSHLGVINAVGEKNIFNTREEALKAATLQLNPSKTS